MKKGGLIFILVSILFFGFSLFLTNTASAQVQSTDVSLSISPKYPAPGDKVTATLSSFVANLDRANMTWSIDGETMLSGVGKKSFSFTLGKLGSTTQLNVDIQTIDRQSFSKSLSLNASEIDMLWEATDSYVPPFYKGKALVSREGYFKVVAIPNIISGGNTLNQNNLSYTWEKDGKGETYLSGWGKSSFIFKNSYLDKSNEILVKISDVFGSVDSGSKITIKTATPKIIFYKKDALFGINLDKSITTGHLIDKTGEAIVAVPYFFSPKDIKSKDLQIDWTINNKPAQNSGIKNEIRLKGEEGKSGEAKIKVKVNNFNTLFQGLDKELNVVF